MISSRTWVVVAATLAALARPASAETGTQVRHLPPVEAPSLADLDLIVTVSRGWESELVMHYRAGDKATWTRVTFARGEAGEYSATIPAEHVLAPGVEYFIDGATVDGGIQRHFASADDPHRVSVYDDPKTVRVKHELGKVKGRRARLAFSAELVDYGTRRIGAHEIRDSYTRLEVDFSYRLLRLPLHTLRFGFTRLLGQVPISSRGDDGDCPPGSPLEDCEQQAGFRAGGWAELSFRVYRGIEVDARGMVQATQEGFAVGARGEGRVGARDGNHVAVGTELIGGEVGSAFFVRLGWATVPEFPMAATVEVTNFPADHRDRAVRLIYDLQHPFENGFRVGGRIGYQARDEGVGGVTGGASVALDF